MCRAVHGGARGPGPGRAGLDLAEKPRLRDPDHAPPVAGTYQRLAGLWRAEGLSCGCPRLGGSRRDLAFAALTLAWRRRKPFALQTGAFWLLVLDAVACAPFAVNLTRKISLRHGIAGDPLRFAARHLDPDARQTVRQIIAARLREEHADAEERADKALDTLQSRLEDPTCGS